MMQCCGPETQAPHDAWRGVTAGGNHHGKRQGRPWKNYGKTLGRPENQRKIMGKSWDNP